MFVRRLKEKKHHIFVTGSSAKLMSREIATALRGSSLSFYIYPFSFREYLAYHQIFPNQQDFYRQRQTDGSSHHCLFRCSAILTNLSGKRKRTLSHIL